MPSASDENALHLPSGDRARCRLNSGNGSGVAMTVTPPASASEHSPCRSDWTARWSATRDAEHAVSTEIAGPSKPNV